MAGRPKKLKVAEVLDALKQSHGLKAGAADLLGVAYNTIERYVQASEEAQQIIVAHRIRRKDRAEYKLDEAIERGESWAIMFTLKNARDREYSDRVDIAGTGELKVTIEYQDSPAGPAPSAAEDKG